MDFGVKRKNYKYRVKRGLHIQASDTRESILQSMPNIEIFDVEDIETTIDTWLTVEDQIIISTNVMYNISYIFKLSTMHDIVFSYNKNCVGKG
jgi:hypothetical protein